MHKKIIIYRDEILRDIEDDTLFVAKMQEAEEATSALKGYRLSADEKDSAFINRRMDKYFNIVIRQLQRYLYKYESTDKADNALTKWKSRAFIIDMPADWPETNLQDLTDNIHSVIASGIEYEYLRRAFGPNNQLVDALRIDIEQGLGQINVNINQRTKQTSTPFVPFDR